MIVAPTIRGRLSLRHGTRNLKVARSPSAVFASPWSRQHCYISSVSSSGMRRFGQPVMAVPLLDSILTNGWNYPSAGTSIAFSTSVRPHIASSSVMKNKAIDWKTGGKGNSKKTLYDPSRETENCGVGLIASLKSVPSRDIVEKADEMLVRMAHRGGCGCDPASGDGSGKHLLVKCIFLYFSVFSGISFIFLSPC